MRVEWHGGKAYSTCSTCGQLVQINKPLFGGLHLCLNDCEQARRHLDVRTRRRGPFWARHTEKYCAQCDAVEVLSPQNATKEND